VRTCAYERLGSLEEVRQVLNAEVYRYNHRQVHATTREIPAVRFRRAQQEGNSLFRKFTIPLPFSSAEDVFCLRTKRQVNGYRKLTLFKHEIEVTKVPLYEEVDIHMIPRPSTELMHLRLWWRNKNVQSLDLPLANFKVHF